MNSEIVKLKVVGVTYNPIESGIYVAVLQEEDGDLRLPIVVGYSDAQAIECGLQTVKTPRPLTHDMAAAMIRAFEIRIESIFIRKLPDGVFTADIVLMHGDERHVIDSRSSDAIAMALRMDAPIFTSRDLLDEVGVLASAAVPEKRQKNEMAKPMFSSTSQEILVQELENAVANEEYEKAAEIKKELDRRRPKP